MNGPDNLVRGIFLSLDIGHMSWPLANPMSTFLGPFKVPKLPQNIKKQHKNLFSGCLEQFLLKEWA
jgi:hypothetical protein